MRVAGVGVLVAVVLGGCTSVKMAQRDGCWVRETKRTFGGTKEELGPCTRPQPKWVEDRLTRLVQECVAQSDYRWQVRAIEAWNRHAAMPAQEPQEAVIQACMNEAAKGVVTQNESLKERLSEIATDREALQADAAQTRDHMRKSNDMLAEFLGEAAKRPPPVATATATATSDGTATTDSGLQADTGAASQALPAAAQVPALPVVPAAGGAESTPARPEKPAASPADPAAPSPKPVKQSRAARRRTALRADHRGACTPPVTASAGPALANGAAPASATPAAAQSATPVAATGAKPGAAASALPGPGGPGAGTR